VVKKKKKTFSNKNEKLNGNPQRQSSNVYLSEASRDSLENFI
jgi:hypothetical protein